MEWIANRPELISALTGLGMLLVWVIYLQVFVSNYRRQLRATLLITRGAGNGLEARCLLSNMSAGPVYVQSVIVTLETAKETLICPATDILELEGEAPSDPMQRTRQGPLASGEIRDIGTFGGLMRHALLGKAANSDAEFLQSVHSITIEILGIYGSEDLPIGARRCFVVLHKDGHPLIQGQDLSTEQIRKRRERRRLITDLERDR